MGLGLASDPMHLPTLPLTDPVAVFAALLVLLLVVPPLAERLRVPGLVGLLLAGIAFGPNGLALLERDAAIVLLGNVGLIFIMFQAGLEVNLNQFAKNRRDSIHFGLLTFVLPQVVGLLMARFVLGFDWLPAILLGSLFASHTLLTYPIVSRLGIGRSRVVTAIIGATILTDTLTLLVLAVVANAARGETGALVWVQTIGLLVAYVALVLWGLPRLGLRVLRRVRSGGVEAYLFVLAAVFVAGFLAEVAGVEPIIGAFFAGLALNRLVPEGSPLAGRLHFSGESLFVPLFLLSTGMLVDVQMLVASTDAWAIAGAMLGTMLVTKYAAVRIGQAMGRFSTTEGGVALGLTLPQAAATLAATLVGFEIGLFDEAVLNGTILMMLVTCIVGPVLTERYGRRLAAANAAAAFDEDETPTRVLVSLSNPETAEALVEVGLLLREGAEPLLPLAVVPPATDGTTRARVAQAERLLAHAAEHAHAAGAPVSVLTRVDANAASGVVRAAEERRATAVVVGWNGLRSAGDVVFGSVLDQLLSDAHDLVLVCRLAHPVSTTAEVVLAVPPLVDRDPGVGAVVHAARTLAAKLGAPLRLIAPPDRLDVLGSALGDGPSTPLDADAWTRDDDALLDALALPGTLVVLASARPNAVGHTAALDRLPARLARRHAGLNLLVAYPPLPEGAVASDPLGLVRT